MTNSITLSEAMEFIWKEAELLDQRNYSDWLNLWTDDGVYVVPIEQDNEDFANRLNYAYDDASMRQMRVKRLESSYSISALTAAETIRTTSRFVVKETRGDELDVRAAQILVEHKRDFARTIAATVDFTLKQTSDGLKIAKKVIWLVNSEDAVFGMGYLL